MEISSPENEAAVARVYEIVVSARQAGQPVTPSQLLVYEIEYMMMEANSGASFEQYFRWADVEQIERVVGFLRQAGLPDVAALTERAVRVAFPNGMPKSDSEKSSLTDWTEDQEQRLQELFAILEENNGRVMNVIGKIAINVLA